MIKTKFSKCTAECGFLWCTVSTGYNFAKTCADLRICLRMFKGNFPLNPLHWKQTNQNNFQIPIWDPQQIPNTKLYGLLEMFIITSWDPVASGFAWNPWDAFHGSGANETLQLWGRSIPGQHHPWNTLHESWHTGFNPLWCLLQIQNVKSHIGKSTCNYWNWFKYWHIVESTLGMGEHQFVIGGSDLVNPSVVYGCMHQNHSPQEWMIMLN